MDRLSWLGTGSGVVSVYRLEKYARVEAASKHCTQWTSMANTIEVSFFMSNLYYTWNNLGAIFEVFSCSGSPTGSGACLC